MKRIKVILFCIITLSFSMIIPFSSFAAETDSKIIDYEQFLVNQYVDGDYLVGIFDIPVSYSKFTITYPTGETYNMSNGFTGNLKWDEPNPYIFDVYPLGNYYFDATDIPDGSWVQYFYTFDNNGSNANGIEHGKLGFSFSFSASARAIGVNDTLLNPNDMYTGMDSITLYGEFSAKTFFNKPEGTKYFQPVISVSLNAPSSVVGNGIRFPFRFKFDKVAIWLSMDGIEDQAASNRLISTILNGYKEQQQSADNFKDSVSNFGDWWSGFENTGSNIPTFNPDDIDSTVNTLDKILPFDEIQKYTNTFHPFMSSEVVTSLFFIVIILSFSSFLLFGKKG